MKNFLILFSACFCISTVSLAQTGANYSIELHEEFKTEEREIPQQYVGSNKNGHYFLYSKGKYGYGSSTLMKFNNEFQPTTEEIPLTQNDEAEEIEERSLGIIEINDKLLNITAKATKTYRKYFAKTVDLNEFKIYSEKEILNLSIDGVNMNKSFMSFVQARDSSSVGLFYTIPSKSTENRKYGLIIFDNDFNKLAEYSYEFPFDKKEFVILSGILLNKEEMIVLTADISNIPKNPNSKKIPNYDYKIIELNQNSSKVLGEIPSDNKWLNNLDLVVDESKIKLVGLYSNVGKYDVHGTFFHQIDRFDPNSTVHKLKPFDQNILDKHIEIPLFGNALKKKIKKYGELAYYIPKSTLEYDDGSILLIAEQTHTFTQYVTTYYFQNLIAILIDKNGEQLWTRMIKKDNSKTNTWIYSSYLVAKDSTDYILLYNGTDKNLNNGDLKRYNAFANDENESLIVTTISKEGVLTQKVVTNKTKTGGFRVRPRLSSKLNENEILLFSQKPSNVKNQRFMILKLGENIANRVDGREP